MQTESGFWTVFLHEVHEHRLGSVTALVGLALLMILPAAIRGGDRTQHRFTGSCLFLFLISVPVHALLTEMQLTGEHDFVSLPASLLLAFGTIGVAAMILFDILGRSLSKMRILRDISSVVAAIVVLFILLHRHGVNIAGLVATSAVLGGVLGFALQETLGNVIGGIALQLEATLSIGDWVTIGEMTGQVVEIRWRSTAIVTRNDDMVVIPNGLLAKGQIVNLSRPVPWHRQWVQFDVHYRHPPNEVQRVVLDALKGIPNVKQDDPPPDCIFYRAEQDHAHYAVRYRLLDLRHDDGTDSEVKKRIWYALRRKGIEIPYPSRNIFVTEMSKEREDAKFEKEHVRRLSALKKVAIFSPLDDDHLDLLAERLRVEVFGVGETILRQGASGDSLFVIRLGSVSVRVNLENSEREVAVVNEGELFGEMSLMTGETRRATVVAKTDVECYVIDRELFQDVLGKRPTLVHEISEILAARAAELNCELDELGVETAHHEARKSDLIGRIKSFFGGASSPGGGR